MLNSLLMQVHSGLTPVYGILAFVCTIIIVVAWVKRAPSQNDTLRLCIGATALHVSVLTVCGVSMVVMCRSVEKLDSSTPGGKQRELEISKHQTSMSSVAIVLVTGAIAVASVAMHKARK